MKTILPQSYGITIFFIFIYFIEKFKGSPTYVQKEYILTDSRVLITSGHPS